MMRDIICIAGVPDRSICIAGVATTDVDRPTGYACKIHHFRMQEFIMCNARIHLYRIPSARGVGLVSSLK